MARRKILLPSPLAVAAGSTFILSVPVGGLTYDSIHLSLTNITDAQLDNIRVKVNGDEIQYFADGAELEDLNDYYGRPQNAGVLSLFFERPEMADLIRERMFGIGTSDIQTFTIEGDIDAACVNPAIVAYAVVSEPAPLGAFTRIRKFPFSFSSSGQVECTGITMGPPIMAMHLKKSDADSVLIQDSNRTLVNWPKTILEADAEGYGRVPQAGYTHVDFCLEGDPAQALLTSEVVNNVVRARDVRFQPSLTTSGALGVIVEYVDTLS